MAIDVNDIELSIGDMVVFPLFGDAEKGHVVRFMWGSKIGFGEYDLVFTHDNKVVGHSECMDDQGDKSMLRKLFELLADKVIIEE